MTFTVDSPSKITAIVPNGATSGPISVKTSSGTAVSSTTFAVIPSPPVDSLPLTVISQTATTITLGWIPVSGAAGYRFLIDGVATSTTMDPNRKSVKFGLKVGQHKYEVRALMYGVSGSKTV